MVHKNWKCHDTSVIYLMRGRNKGDISMCDSRARIVRNIRSLPESSFLPSDETALGVVV